MLGLSCAAVIAPPSAQADHEISYFPSFYPQEIRIEPLRDAEEGAEMSDSDSENSGSEANGTAPGG